MSDVGRWAGRKVRRLVDLTLHTKGTVCHLCGYPGADSADHDPPRSVLIASGCTTPDELPYLWPAHLLCNWTRNDRPLTPSLREECRRKYEQHHGMAPTPGHNPALSPRFASRRPPFPDATKSKEANASPSPRLAQKNGGSGQTRPGRTRP